MTLLSGTVQPPLLTLLSSTSQPALSPLFRIVTDDQHPKDAFIAVVQDDQPSSSHDGTFIPRSSTRARASHVLGRVIHIQSPDPRKTYIQAGDRKGKGRATPHDDRQPLGIELPWVGMQIKRLGQRGMSVEFGIVDERGLEGVIRLSSYKTEASVHLDRTPPLIHLPLQLPAIDQHTLTDWLDVTLNLASLVPLFNSLPRDRDAQDATETGVKRRKDEVPSDRLAYVSYVRVYADCRTRRIWFSQDGPRTLEQAGVTDEWALYAAKNSVP